ncbi:hypothetical protein [Maritalea myrionectae]|uniref:Uncharacterized protein n=1 Tax=Maritalea myrionectae TaxID=454601 RepID=A0A2R4MD84_9HYPH|nr:hypothetical protein [Maritalea myrionectae]AVX03972.1 hypothetical protein MXMO3_01442 [Maritalea myrionectae]
MTEKKNFFRNIVSAMSKTRDFHDPREQQNFVATQSYRNLLGSYDHTNGF